MGYIPFGASPRLCSKPFTGVQCLEVLSCGLRPRHYPKPFTGVQCLEVLSCGLRLVFTRNRLLVYNVLQNRLACILSAKNALVDGANFANSVPSYAMRYRDEGASFLFEQRTQEIKHHREDNDYLLCGKNVAQICCK